MLKPRNMGFWNLGAEEIMFSSLPTAMICSLVKVMNAFIYEQRRLCLLIVMEVSFNCH